MSESRPALAVSDQATGHDRDILEQLIDRLGRICLEAAAERRDCAGCAERRMHRCRDVLGDIATDLMAAMIAHFDREDDVMRALPATPPIELHCERHRRSHVEFSTRYNAIVAAYRGSNVIANARRMESFLRDWTRVHALECDAALAELLSAALSERRDGATPRFA